MEFSDEEVEVIKRLIEDFGFEYGFVSKTEEILELAKKLKMEKWVKDNE